MTQNIQSFIQRLRAQLASPAFRMFIGVLSVLLKRSPEEIESDWKATRPAFRVAVIVILVGCVLSLLFVLFESVLSE